MVKSENPKLHIKISRSDNEKDIKIMDKLNINVRDHHWQIYTNLIFAQRWNNIELYLIWKKFLMKMNILAIELTIV